MGISAEGSYALVFTLVFVLVGALTVVTAKLFDKTPQLPDASSAPPFPNASPYLPVPTADPRTQVKCLAYGADPKTGVLTISATAKLTACESGAQCDGCAAQFPNASIKCLPADTWPGVKDYQAAMNNKADKYCLPERTTCINPTAVDQLTQCRNDSDCFRCTDKLANAQTFTCQQMAVGQKLVVDKQVVEAPMSDTYCVPVQQGCDPKYGVATWTEETKWTCRCKYPDIYGGPQCNELTACNARQLTPWSKERQKLLLNVVGKNGEAVGTPWSAETGVDPNKCVNEKQEQVECAPGLQRTVACQCDGVQRGTLATYTYDPTTPVQCMVDPCYNTNFAKGKTWLWDAAPGNKKDALPVIPGLPATTCACSGLGSHAWLRKNDAAGSETQGYSWQGYCKPYSIPGTQIQVQADAETGYCERVKQANTDAGSDKLIPGQDVRGESTCVPDPCAGVFADTTYNTAVDVNYGTMGHFDAASGKCLCTAPAMSTPVPSCNPRVTPGCSVCANACLGGDDVECPVNMTGDLKDAGCVNKCSTDAAGNKVCTCGDNCFLYNGKCHAKVASHKCCAHVRGLPGVCLNPRESCKSVRSIIGHNPFGGKHDECSNKRNDYIEQAYICTRDDVCGTGWCKFSRNNDIDPCGGAKEYQFVAGCGRLRG